MTVSDPTATQLKTTDEPPIWQSENVKAVGLFIVSLILFLLFWEVGANLKLFAKGMPTASKTLQELW
ncbi:MAG: nitrate ABC transporter permease, partial [Cyanobacteria bacterium J06607_13]